MSVTRGILIFLVSGFLSQIVYYYPNLPERIASHFNAFGEADGWMSKTAYLIFQIVLLLFLAFFSFVFPIFIKKMPVSTINLPNKDYWLAPEHRDRTYGILSRKFEWFGIALCCLMISINQLVIHANLSGRNLSIASWYFLGTFLLFVIVWSISLCKDFKIPQ